MRVLQLGPYPPPHGGVQTNLVAIHRALRARGDDARVANITSTRRPSENGVDYPRNAAELFYLLVRRRYDIVHVHLGGDLSGRLLALCFLCTLLPGARTVVTFHSGGYASSPAGRSAERRDPRGIVFRRFDRIVAVNAEIVSFFERLGVPADRITLILPHAVDTTVAHDASVSLSPAIASFVATHSPRFLTVGLLEPEYEIESQIDVLDRVRRVHANAGLVIVGSGSLHEVLARAIDASPSRDHILLCGDVPHEQTLRLIAGADVLLRTTRYDGDSVAVREGLAHATPVVASDNGMRPAGVHLYPIGDVAALERAIETALAAGRGAGVRDADTRNIDAVLDLYQGLLGASGEAVLHAAQAE